MTDGVDTADPAIFIVHAVLQVILHTGESDMARLGIHLMITEVMDEKGQCHLIIEGGTGRSLLIIGGMIGPSLHMVGGTGLSPLMVGGIGLSPLIVSGIVHYLLTVGESGHGRLTVGESSHDRHMIGGMEQHHHIQDVIDQCLLQILRIGVLTDPEIDIIVVRVYLDSGSFLLNLITEWFSFTSFNKLVDLVKSPSVIWSSLLLQSLSLEIKPSSTLE